MTTVVKSHNFLVMETLHFHGRDPQQQQAASACSMRTKVADTTASVSTVQEFNACLAVWRKMSRTSIGRTVISPSSTNCACDGQNQAIRNSNVQSPSGRVTSRSPGQDSSVPLLREGIYGDGAHLPQLGRDGAAPVVLSITKGEAVPNHGGTSRVLLSRARHLVAAQRGHRIPSFWSQAQRVDRAEWSRLRMGPWIQPHSELAVPPRLSPSNRCSPRRYGRSRYSTCPRCFRYTHRPERAWRLRNRPAFRPRCLAGRLYVCSRKIPQSFEGGQARALVPQSCGNSGRAVESARPPW